MNTSLSSAMNTIRRVENSTASTPESSSPTMIQRVLIVFGSICFLWFILGLVFASIQTVRRWKRKSAQKCFRSHRPIVQTFNDDNQSMNDDNDDQASVSTAVSYLSERSRRQNDPTLVTSSLCERIPEEDFQLDFPVAMGVSNMAFSQSTLTSNIDNGRALLYYPACRNFAYSQSTLASSTADLHIGMPAPSISSTNEIYSPRRTEHKRNSSQSSTATGFSQITNATYLSTNSASMMRQKIHLLPTLMITDCDRLQTDIIELDDFEPEKDWRRSARPELRRLLNDRLPQAVRWSMFRYEIDWLWTSLSKIKSSINYLHRLIFIMTKLWSRWIIFNYNYRWWSSHNAPDN